MTKAINKVIINAIEKSETEKDLNDCYWDVNQLSKYLGVSLRTVRRHFINDPRWPKPISFGSAKCKRWLASECRKALLLFRVD